MYYVVTHRPEIYIMIGNMRWYDFLAFFGEQIEINLCNQSCWNGQNKLTFKKCKLNFNILVYKT